MSFLWKTLHHPEEIDDLKRLSHLRPQVIFKHSSRCSLSSVAKRRLETNEISEDIDFHFLDVITYRDISNLVGQVFEVWHESPQVLLIVNGECIYDESHLSISMHDILEQAGAK
jgi:bacillithiol system protein YtxJ